MKLRKLEMDPKSPAVRTLADLGVSVWVHDRFYGLVADKAAPHGYRLVASATALDTLLARVRERLAR